MDNRTKEIILGQAINHEAAAIDCKVFKKDFLDGVRYRFKLYLELHAELIK
jgi:hypothetical protein